MNISLNTLMLAIKAIDHDIKRYEEIANNEMLNDEDADYYGQYVLDLTQGLSELGGLYQTARESHPECPALDELLKGNELDLS